MQDAMLSHGQYSTEKKNQTCSHVHAGQDGPLIVVHKEINADLPTCGWRTG